jgi:hypothetical protein
MRSGNSPPETAPRGPHPPPPRVQADIDGSSTGHAFVVYGRSGVGKTYIMSQVRHSPVRGERGKRLVALQKRLVAFQASCDGDEKRQ